MTASDIAERYGRTRKASRRNRLIALVAAVAVAVVFAAWAIWVGLFQPSASIETSDVGSSNLSDAAVKITWQLSVNPGTDTKCAMQALNENFGVVGWKIIDVPPAPVRSRTLTETLRTSEASYNGLIYRCWQP